MVKSDTSVVTFCKTGIYMQLLLKLDTCDIILCVSSLLREGSDEVF